MYTTEEQELVKCHQDPIYFIETYCKIQHPIQELIPFLLKEHQQNVIYNIHENRMCIFDKDRQVGMSTLLMAYVYWKSIFNPDERILVTSYTYNGCIHLRHILSVFIENTPKWLLPKLTTNNKRGIEFENGSRIMLSSIYSNVGRGLSLSMLVCDEFALGKEQEMFWLSIIPCLHSNKSKAVIASTINPNTPNYFNELLQQSSEGKTHLKLIKVSSNG